MDQHLLEECHEINPTQFQTNMAKWGEMLENIMVFKSLMWYCFTKLEFHCNDQLIITELKRPIDDTSWSSDSTRSHLVKVKGLHHCVSFFKCNFNLHDLQINFYMTNSIEISVTGDISDTLVFKLGVTT